MKSPKNPFASCLAVALAGCLLPAAQAAPIAFSTLTLVGTSQLVTPNLLRLTPNADANTVDPPAGAAWTPNVVNVQNPFSVSFAFRMSEGTGQVDPDDGGHGDGIAFVIHNDFRGTGAIGRGAGGMGFLGIFNSLAIMFDTYQNNYAYGDPNGNYVAVNTRGPDFNVPHHFCTGGALTTDLSKPLDLPDTNCTSNPSLGMSVVGPALMDDGAVHHVLLVFQPGLLTVTLDSVQVLAVSLDLTQILSLQNGNSAFLGFTAGTRFSYQNQDILDFDVTPIPEPGTALACLGGLALLAFSRLTRRTGLQQGA